MGPDASTRSDELLLRNTYINAETRQARAAPTPKPDRRGRRLTWADDQQANGEIFTIDREGPYTTRKTILLLPTVRPLGGQWAAARIQRAWRLRQFARKAVGFVHSLDWLQRHNMLYGTELAEQDDLER